jgi:hypothetical protein
MCENSRSFDDPKTNRAEDRSAPLLSISHASRTVWFALVAQNVMVRLSFEAAGQTEFISSEAIGVLL